MKKTLIGLTLSAALLAGVAWAQDHAEFQGWMKTTAASFGSLRKSVMAKDGPAAAETAEKMSGIFKEVGGHFEEHKMQDGIDFAHHASEAAADLAMAAKAGDWDKAEADLKTVGAQCQGCHGAHREKLPDGSFKMK